MNYTEPYIPTPEDIIDYKGIEAYIREEAEDFVRNWSDLLTGLVWMRSWLQGREARTRGVAYLP